MIIVFIYTLDNRQNEFIAAYNKKTMTMSDYTIRVKNLPNDAEYGGKEEILKAHLWTHFESLLVKKYQAQSAHANANNHDEEAAPINQATVPQACQVVDITFGKKKFESTQKLIRMNSLCNEAHIYKMNMEMTPDSKRKEMFSEKMIACE